jgi:hypothetical protein
VVEQNEPQPATPGTTRTTRLALACAAVACCLAIVGAVAIVASGGNSSPSAQPGGGRPGFGGGRGGGFDSAAMTKFTECMKAHGVTPPARGGGARPQPSDNAKLRTAMAACRQLAPMRGPGGGGGFGSPSGSAPPSGGQQGSPVPPTSLTTPTKST